MPRAKRYYIRGYIQQIEKVKEFSGDIKPEQKMTYCDPTIISTWKDYEAILFSYRNSGSMSR